MQNLAEDGKTNLMDIGHWINSIKADQTRSKIIPPKSMPNPTGLDGYQILCVFSALL